MWVMWHHYNNCQFNIVVSDDDVHCIRHRGGGGGGGGVLTYPWQMTGKPLETVCLHVRLSMVQSAACGWEINGSRNISLYIHVSRIRVDATYSNCRQEIENPIFSQIQSWNSSETFTLVYWNHNKGSRCEAAIISLHRSGQIGPLERSVIWHIFQPRGISYIDPVMWLTFQPKDTIYMERSLPSLSLPLWQP